MKQDTTKCTQTYVHIAGVLTHISLIFIIFECNECLMCTIQRVTELDLKFSITFYHDVRSRKDWPHVRIGLFQPLHSYHPTAFHMGIQDVPITNFQEPVIYHLLYMLKSITSVCRE